MTCATLTGVTLDELPTEVRTGDLLWTPSPERVEQAGITAFTRWLKDTRGLELSAYRDLWQWSVTDLDAFWQAIWDYNDILSTTRPVAVLGRREMPGAQWFPGATLNYAEHVLRNERPGEVALYFTSETTPVTPLYWDDLAPKVRTLATHLRNRGIRPGDRVASVLPNVPEAVIAMLATTSIGAIWTSVSPDFGWRGVLDRFRQLQPRVLIATGGYQYGGKDFDRSSELAAIIGDLQGHGLEQVIYLPFKDVPKPVETALDWADIVEAPRTLPLSSSSTGARSGCRCGSCSPPGRPGCRRPSRTATAASCWNSSSCSGSTWTSSPATSCSSSPPRGG